MPVSKAQQAATARYEDKVYDKVLVRLPKGQKEIIKAHAEARGKSVNGFINEAIEEKLDRESETMERDKKSPAGPGEPTEDSDDG